MDLLPCPFCGGEAKYAVIEGARYSHVVECKGCASTAGGSTFPNEKYNAEKWNTRSNPQADALAEALRGLLDRVSKDRDSQAWFLDEQRAATEALAAYEEGEVTPPEKVSADMDAAVCDCYPNHCEHGDTCWCEPTVELLDNGDKLIIHNKGH